VDLKDSTKSWGKSDINPIVSSKTAFYPEINVILRLVVESV